MLKAVAGHYAGKERCPGFSVSVRGGGWQLVSGQREEAGPIERGLE